LCEFVVAGGQGNASQVNVVIDVHGQARQHILNAFAASFQQPLVRSLRIAIRHCLQCKEPHRVVLHARCAPLEHESGDFSSLACQISVSGVDPDLSESHDSGGVQKVHNVFIISLRESLA
jgi:hypothetical protein